MRRFRAIAADHRRLDRWLGDLLVHLLGLASYGLPRRPDFLTFSCASGASLSPPVAGVDGRGVCNAPVDGPALAPPITQDLP